MLRNGIELALVLDHISLPVETIAIPLSIIETFSRALSVEICIVLGSTLLEGLGILNGMVALDGSYLSQ